eukprot:scaffold138611_cov40-Prasinocladus_malaysianus.AAC.1
MAAPQWVSIAPQAMALPAHMAPFFGAVPMYHAVYPGGPLALMAAPFAMVGHRGAMVQGCLPPMNAVAVSSEPPVGTPGSAPVPSAGAAPKQVQQQVPRSQANPASIKFTRLCKPTAHHAASMNGDLPKLRAEVEASTATKADQWRPSVSSAFTMPKAEVS